MLTVHDEAFLGPAKAALDRHGELLLSLAHRHDNNYISAWFLVHTDEEIQQVVPKGRRLHYFEAFPNPRLPLRGVVDAVFTRQAVALLEAHCDDVLLAAVVQPGRIELDAAHFDQAEDLTAWLRQHWSQWVAFGPTSAEYLPALRPPATHQSVMAQVV